MTLRELRDYAKKTWLQEFEIYEECFLESFQSGEYHEEHLDWISLGERLPNHELASLYLPVCRALIATSIQHREGPTLKLLMNCYSALGRWQRKQLKSPEEVLKWLALVRPLVFEVVVTGGGSRMAEVFYGFWILEIGILRRMGAFDDKLIAEYQAVESKLAERWKVVEQHAAAS